MNFVTGIIIAYIITGCVVLQFCCWAEMNALRRRFAEEGLDIEIERCGPNLRRCIPLILNWTYTIRWHESAMNWIETRTRDQLWTIYGEEAA